MKRLIYYWTFILIGCIAVFSCKRAELVAGDGPEGGILYSFTAEYPLAESSDKATLDMTSLKTTWDSGDKIRVFNGTNFTDFTFDGTRFTSDTGLPYNAQYGFAMVYPNGLALAADHSVVDNHIRLQLHLPASQTYVEGKCKNMPLVAFAGQGTWSGVYFKHLCGFMGFSVTGDPDKGSYSNVQLTATGLCGAMNLDFTGESGADFDPTYGKPSGGSTVTLSGWSTGAGTTDAQKTYYMYIPAGTYTDVKVLVHYPSANDVGRDGPAEDFVVERAVVRSAGAYFQTLFSGGGVDDTASSSEACPYLIKNEADLLELRAKVNNSSNGLGGFYKLVNDIALSDAWTETIGPSSTKPFKGTFDGNGRTISNLSVSTSSADNPAGLFGYVNGGTVKNLSVGTSEAGCVNTGSRAAAVVGLLTGGGTVDNCTVLEGSVIESGGNMAGAIAGAVIGSTISNCTNEGADISCTSASSSRCGGIVGIAEGGSTRESVISSCRVTGGTVSAPTNVGGIVGEMSGANDACSITGCEIGTATVKGTATGENAFPHVGGIVGLVTKGTVRDCVNTGATVTGLKYVGGIVGRVNNTVDNGGEVTIQRCTTKVSQAARISADSMTAGGIVGLINGKSGVNVSVSQCENNQAVSVTGTDAGGIVGDVSGASISTTLTNCTNYGTVTVIPIGEDVPENTSGQRAGGIAGRVRGSARVADCRNLGGTVTARMVVGGIVGALNSDGEISGTPVRGAIYQCCVSDAVTVEGTRHQTTGVHAGGICGMHYKGSVVRCYSACEVKGCAKLGGIVGNMQLETSTITPLVVDACQAAGKITTTWENLDWEYCCGGIVGRIADSNINATIMNCIANNVQYTVIGSCSESGVGGLVGSNDSKGEYVRIYNSVFFSNNKSIWYKDATGTNTYGFGFIVGKMSHFSTAELTIDNVAAYAFHPICYGGSQTQLYISKSGQAAVKAFQIGVAVGQLKGSVNTKNFYRIFAGNVYASPCNYYGGTSGVTIKDYVTGICNDQLSYGPGTADQPKGYGPAITTTIGSFTPSAGGTGGKEYSWNWPAYTGAPDGVFEINPTHDKITAEYADFVNIPNLWIPTNCSSWAYPDTTKPSGASTRKLGGSYNYPVPQNVAWPDMAFDSSQMTFTPIPSLQQDELRPAGF